MSHTPTTVAKSHTTSRRALLGLGTTPPVLTQRTQAMPPEPRPIAEKPYAEGGPTSRDASMASAVEMATPVAPGRQYATYVEAYKAAGTTTSTVFPGFDPRGHILRRATFGPRPKDVTEIKTIGITKWIDRQLSPSSITDTLGDAVWKSFPLAGASSTTIVASINQFSWDAVFQTAQASLARQIFSQRQLFEIVVDIFANHLHVPLPGEQWHTAPSYLRNVIRANALGSYTTMLLAAMKHPAMLNYLNNDESRKKHVNENLGRELLELHTVGVASGYTEADVKASAAILSGRTWDWRKGTYIYNPNEHVTGPVQVLGFSHANATGAGGEAVGDAYLRYLATHPATARTIARKIAVRFVADSPSDDLVNRLAAVYLSSGTSIKATVRAVFLSSDFWASVGTRMRRPLEDAVGMTRVLNLSRTSTWKTPLSWLYWTLDEAGHTPHGWGPPNGYPDVAAAWLGAGSMISRWNLHRVFVYGWWKGFAYTSADKLVARTSGMTTLQWTAALAKRLCGTTPPQEHLLAIIAGSQLKPSSPAPTTAWACGKVATLLLDSPYFQLR